ncbi:MAG: hypothetical protein A2509_11140 [Candidatus Edwardsbacteria bacterium RIFOXYD12_FULL_50_11]|uniref:O-antigen ligase-related domain-containing protein n=1 Tax=Candidatus Edwardsbacteria bacterium GWF2_54_11 TaxID=1817851 RepID=A0A1F5R9P4_9BACT|nr:MAG: hypothetical protein A2502_11870 [Candidatus Edwardsbacteria bacterium RifOxyC12_full_54_24]OGF08211.1 MAG: hypothetical protein A2273_07640 [Candidatus Edwardsbacteria bacterium RifOxyA12_full_54_48]OGF11135.1 MAG: hypothetical protein A2024_07670 [Candidatus Edwardsbacteria bacterium GWF2_54_11]OGF11508.1 MAG: hypothetical protein A3K15_04110 [Candidatus Edwardsbacteria bacterium GWE2_54_12]OGF14810.1 MAG: hypothetical protein A2509_11140 [Candidatus Edwardsbacteria bacterium RIFOXYD1
MIIFLAIVLFIKNIILRKPIFKIDFIVIVFSLFFLLSVASFAKWVSLYRGIRGSLPLYILPLLIYIIFNSGYVSRKGAERYFTLYFPLIYTYIIGQLIFIIYQGTAVTGKSYMEFHTGFDLGWGKSVFVSAVLTFFVFLLYRTRKLWNKKTTIRNLVYFDYCVSAVVLILIMARAPIVSFLGALLLYYIYRKYSFQQEMEFKLSYVIYAILITVPLYFVFKAFVLYLIERFIHMKTDASFLVRIYMYSDGLNTFLHNPLTGVGPDQHYFKQLFSYKETDPNNVFLSYAVSFGVIGLSAICTLFLLPFIKIARRSKINKKDVIPFGSLLLPVFLLSIINSSVEIVITSFAYGAIFWILYALFNKMIDCEIDNNTGIVKWK